MLWSAFVPGLGQVLNHRLPLGVFILVWWIVIVYMSHGLEGLWFTMTGQFAKVVQLCDPQWLLYLPSMYGYAVYDAYCTRWNTTSCLKWNNQVLATKLSKQALPDVLERTVEAGGSPLYVISTFEQTSYLEMAIGALHRHGIPEEHILAVPLDKRAEAQRLMDTMYYSDGTSLFDAAALAGTFFGALGTIVGYSLPWGPIAWGIIGFLFGGVLGFYINYLVTKKRRKAQPRG